MSKKVPYGKRLERLHRFSVGLLSVPVWSVVVYVCLRTDIFLAVVISAVINFAGYMCATQVLRVKEFDPEYTRKKGDVVNFTLGAVYTPLFIFAPILVFIITTVKIIISKHDEKE